MTIGQIKDMIGMLGSKQVSKYVRLNCLNVENSGFSLHLTKTLWPAIWYKLPTEDISATPQATGAPQRIVAQRSPRI